MSLLKWEFRRAARDGALRIGLVLFLVCGLLAVVYGTTQIARQNEVMDAMGQLVRGSDEVYFTHRFHDEEDIGRVHYYLSQATVHRPLPQAALSLGQRDLHSYHQTFRLRSLYTNLFDAGFENPERAAAGHFDLAFVLVFLLPLVVIACTYDMLSREAESNTLATIRAAGTPLPTILRARLLSRFALIGTAALLLLVGAWMGVGAPPGALGPWLVLTVGYLVFWFGLSAAVVGLAQPSARSAGILLGIWTLLTIVFPSLLALALPREATQSGAALTIRCRQVINNGWDADKAETLEMAARHDPRYREAPVLDENFTWSWYYAMHDAGDEAVKEQAAAYFEGLEDKDRKSFSYSALVLPVRMQLLFDRLAGTDLTTHTAYYQFVKASREKMRQRFLPRVFAEENLNQEEILRLHDDLEVLAFEPSPPSGVARHLAEFWAVALLVALLGWFGLSAVEARIQRKGL